MTVVSTIKMTAGQFRQLRKDPTGVRLELVDGEVAVSPGPEFDHAIVVSELQVLLKAYADRAGLGKVVMDVDVELGPHDVRRPDILFFPMAKARRMGQGRPNLRPDLAVEVVSPSSDRIDKADKFRQYAKGGIKYYWIVDPEERVFEAYVLKGGRYVLSARGAEEDVVRAEPFKDLAIPLKKLWWPK